MDKKLLGRRVNSARKDRGTTSEKLAEACHVNPAYLRQIESGMKTPNLPLVIEMHGCSHGTVKLPTLQCFVLEVLTSGV